MKIKSSYCYSLFILLFALVVLLMYLKNNRLEAMMTYNKMKKDHNYLQLISKIDSIKHYKVHRGRIFGNAESNVVLLVTKIMTNYNLVELCIDEGNMYFQLNSVNYIYIGDKNKINDLLGDWEDIEYIRGQAYYIKVYSDFLQ